MSSHTDFGKAFTDGLAVIDRSGSHATISVLPAGELEVTTGRIIACAPYDFGAEAFTAPVPLGRHSVFVSVVRFEDGASRVACAML